MISSFSIGNFKAFGPTQNVPIKPITLIFGPNSAGKSSIIHSLLLARHALEHNGKLDVVKTEIGGDSVDLGGFRQYVFKRNAGASVEWSAQVPATELPERVQTFVHGKTLKLTVVWKHPLDDLGQPVDGSSPEVVSTEVFVDGESSLRMSRRADKTLQIDRLGPQILNSIGHAIISNFTTSQAETPEDVGAVTSTLAEAATGLRFSAEGFFPGSVIGDQTSGLSPLSQFRPVAKSTREADMIESAKLFGPRLVAEVVAGVTSTFSRELNRLTYLGPLRSYPQRHLAFADDHDRNWYAGGGYAWDIVRTSPSIREAVNRWLGSDRLKSRYRLEGRSLTSLESIEAPLRDALDGLNIDIVQEGDPTSSEYHDPEPPVWGVKDPDEEATRVLKWIRQSGIEVYQDLTLVDMRNDTQVSHRDVGIGISQVLPVLVHAYADRERIVAIEQPEIHLHPAVQAELGGLFIQSALGEQRNTFILETHSEHLILRIMRRMRETHRKGLPPGMPPVSPKDVSILYVEPDGDHSIIREMPLNAMGELAKAWPGGFFEEGLREVIP